jgi:hypothetical protein
MSTIGTITLDPKLISIEPAIGSIGGSVIIVTGSGFGTEVTDLNLYDSTNDR